MKVLNRKKRKRFGQHFLKNESIAAQIVDFAEISRNETVLEIGPGKGILTSTLLQQAKEVVAVEIDDGLVRYLNRRFSNNQNFSLIHKDILKYDLPPFFKKIKVIGNLPYSIGTKIITYLTDSREKFSQMVFMLQKEVAERLAASPGAKDYGSLSIFIQLHYDIEILMDIPPNSFSPPPRVFSTLVKMKPKKQLSEHFDNADLFHKVVTLAFSHRRKKLRNNLKPLQIGENNIENIGKEAGIDINLRGEMLSIEDYIELTRSISKYISP